MNTDKDSLLAILQPYRVAVDMQENDRTVFWHVREESGDPAMELTLQTVNDEIYSIYFLNNQFFELPKATLLQVLRSILNGTYSVIGHGDARHIVVLEGKEKILPERITSAADYARFYDVLPRTFVARATLFEGFDPLPLDQNGFELFLSGKPYLSLYHDGRLDDFQ